MTNVPPIVYAGLDEAGSLTSDVPVFTIAAVITAQPEPLRSLIRRAALRSGKRQHRSAKVTTEIKWRSASQRIRIDVLTALAGADVDIYALTVHKEGRRIADSPQNYGILVCELMSMCWDSHPNIALSLDRHFTNPLQVAEINTLIYRRWPEQGLLMLVHVDSQRNHLVQLADMVAGAVYDWHKVEDASVRLIEPRMCASSVADWRQIRARWLDQGKQKTELPDQHAPSAEDGESR